MTPPPAEYICLQLQQIIADLADEERAVLLHVAGRLLMGQQTYGKMHVATDPRDFAAEASDEVADLLVYCSMAWLKRELARRQNAAGAR